MDVAPFGTSIWRSVTWHHGNEAKLERDQRFHRIAGREPACMRENRVGVAATGIFHSHDPHEKCEAIREWSLDCGPHMDRVLNATDFAYLNRHNQPLGISVSSP